MDSRFPKSHLRGLARELSSRLRVTLRGAWRLLQATGTVCAWHLPDARENVRILSADAAETVLEILCQHGASYGLRLAPAGRKPITGHKPKKQAVARYDARLIKRVAEEHKAGRSPEFRMDMVEADVRITSVDDSGNLRITVLNEDMTLELQWQRLTLEERKRLALAVLRHDKAADHALAAFYMLATGDTRGASRHLIKAGDEAAEVKAAFE